MNKTPKTGKQRKGRLAVCLALVLLLLLQTAAFADDAGGASIVDPDELGEKVSAVIYNNTNGLPTSEANDIAQTEEGFIWIGSYSGLIRYDGSTFERMDSTSGLTSVVSLLADNRDRLWIGTNDNGLGMMENGQLRIWDESDGLSASKITSIEEGPDGTIYIGTISGVTMITPELELRAITDPKIENAYVEKLSRGSEGLIYGITNEDDSFILRGDQLEDFVDHNESSFEGITSIFADQEHAGEVYIGTSNYNFYHGDPKKGLDAMECLDISPLFTVIGIQQIGDQIWICANNGIGVLDGDGFHCLDSLPMNNSVGNVMADHEGNLWFTSARQGVMKLVRNQFQDVFLNAGLPEQVVNSTCLLGDRLYIATDTGLLALDGEEPVASIPLTSAKTASGEDLGADDLLQLLDGCRIRSVIADSRGRLWISTWRACGLLRYEDGVVTAFTEEEGLQSNHLRAIWEMEDGSVLVAVTGGACVIDGDRVIAAYGKDDGIENPETLTVCAAPNGDCLLGSNGGGIYIVNDDGVRCLKKQDGLGSETVMRIKHDPARHLFWIVTSNSLAYMTEDYQITTIQNFPYSNNFDLYENSKGDMWILSSNGIYVLPTEELLANGEITPVYYGLANGLPCTATGNSYSSLSPNGDLYIAGSSGVPKVNIEASLEEIQTIKQAVPYLDADDERIYPDEDGAFHLPSSVQKVTVYPFVFNYSLTDPQVSYQLAGFDQKATTVVRSELAPVTYTNLRGGAYQFEMELKDAMGRGSNQISVPIVKEKALYEQTWFYLVAALAALLLLFAGVGLYVRRKMLEMEAQHREEAERERITSELQMANRIQGSMLPHDFPPFPDRKEFDLYAVMEPAREVGGDFYDFFLIDDDHLCIVMADVSGKGIPAALFMMISKTLLQSFAGQSLSAAEILNKTNETLCSNYHVDMFVTVWLGILEISTGKIVAANAGHEYPILMQDGQFRLLKDKHGLVIGGMEGMRYHEYEIVLQPGDKLFVYTDGIPEANDAELAMFGTDRLLAALNKATAEPPKQVLKTVRGEVNAFVREAEQFDDLTMLCLEFRGGTGSQRETNE